MTSDELTITERNALKWVLFKEWYDKMEDVRPHDLGVLLRMRVAVLEGR